MKKRINTKNAPQAIGPYSQAVLFRDFLFISGQIAINPKTQKIESKDIESQTNQVLRNISEILKEENLDFSNILRCEVFLKDINNFSKVNKIYETYFEKVKVKPSRVCVEVSNLPKKSLIEMSAICYKDK